MREQQALIKQSQTSAGSADGGCIRPRAFILVNRGQLLHRVLCQVKVLLSSRTTVTGDAVTQLLETEIEKNSVDVGTRSANDTEWLVNQVFECLRQERLQSE